MAFIEAIDEYRSSLADLVNNSKPLINMLTMLAEDHEEYASEIVHVIETHIQKVKPTAKLPVMYLIDSILKNLRNSNYITAFTSNIVQIFCGTFEKVDEKTRQCMFKLRQTWNEIFPTRKLYMIDVRVNQMDPAWPITAASQGPGSIHINPKFIKQTPEVVEEPVVKEEDQESEMRQQLIAKQQELLKLQQERLELELAETRAKLERQKQAAAAKKDWAAVPPITKEAIPSELPLLTQTLPPVRKLALAAAAEIPSTQPRIRPAPAMRDPRLTRDPRVTTRDHHVTVLPGPPRDPPTAAVIPVAEIAPRGVEAYTRNTVSPVISEDVTMSHPAEVAAVDIKSSKFSPKKDPSKLIERKSKSTEDLSDTRSITEKDSDKAKESGNKSSRKKSSPSDKNISSVESRSDSSRTHKRGNTSSTHSKDSSRQHSRGRSGSGKPAVRHDKPERRSRSSSAESGSSKRDDRRDRLLPRDRSYRKRRSGESSEDDEERSRHQPYKREKLDVHMYDQKPRSTRSKSPDLRPRPPRLKSPDVQKARSTKSKSPDVEMSLPTRVKSPDLDKKSRPTRSKSPDIQKSQSTSSTKSPEVQKTGFRRSKSPLRLSSDPRIKIKVIKDDAFFGLAENIILPAVEKESSGKDISKSRSGKDEDSKDGRSERKRPDRVKERSPKSTSKENLKSEGHENVSQNNAQNEKEIPTDVSETVDKKVVPAENKKGFKIPRKRVKTSEKGPAKTHEKGDASEPTSNKVSRCEDNEIDAQQSLDGDISDLFGSEDQDYRQMPVTPTGRRVSQGPPLKSPSSARWAKFKAEHPQEFPFSASEDVDERVQPTSPTDVDMRVLGLPRRPLSPRGDPGYPPMAAPPLPPRFHKRPASDRRLSLTAETNIPRELSLQSRGELLMRAESLRHSGELSHHQHQEILSAIGEIDVFRREQEFKSKRSGDVDLRGQEQIMSPPRKPGNFHRRLDLPMDVDLRGRPGHHHEDIVSGGHPRDHPPISPRRDGGPYPEDMGRLRRDGAPYPEDIDRPRRDSGPYPEDRDRPRRDGGPYPENMDRPRRDGGPYPKDMDRSLRDGGPFPKDLDRPRRDGGPYPKDMDRPRRDGGPYPEDLDRPRRDGGPYPEDINRPRRDGGPYPEDIDRLRRDGGAYPEDMDRPRRDGGPYPEDINGPRRDGPRPRDHNAMSPPRDRHGPMPNRIDKQRDHRQRSPPPRDVRGHPTEEIGHQRSRKPHPKRPSPPPRHLSRDIPDPLLCYDLRWAANPGMLGFDDQQEVVMDKVRFALHVDARPRKVELNGYNFELFADGEARAVRLNGDIVYTFGEPVKDVKVGSVGYKFFFHGPSRLFWLNGHPYDIRIDAPPKVMQVGDHKFTVQIDGRDMMFLVDRIEKGLYGGPPRKIIIEGRHYDIQFEPPVKRILVDAEQCELCLSKRIPVILIKGKPHLIAFDGPPRNVIIDGNSFLVPCDTPVRIRLGSRSHILALGGPAHEVVIDGKWFEVKFGGPPRQIQLGIQTHIVALEGPPPDVKILKEVPDDFEIRTDKNYRRSLMSIPNAITTPVSNPPIGVTEGPGRPHPMPDRIKPLMEVEFRPPGAMQGPNMLRPHGPQPIRADGPGHILGPRPDGPFQPRNMGPPGLQMPAPGHMIDLRPITGEMEGPGPMSAQMGTSAPVPMGGPLPIVGQRPLQAMQMGPGFGPRQVDGPIPMHGQMGGLRPLPGPVGGPGSMGMPSGPSQPALPMDPSQISISPSILADVSQSLNMLSKISSGQLQPKPVVPLSMPGLQASQSAIPTSLSGLLPSGLSQAPAPAPAPLDISSLFQKLLGAGIINKGSEKPKQQEPSVEETEEKPEILEEIIEEVPDISDFKSAKLKRRYNGVIQRLYSGIQCSSCGMRFVLQDTERYREHLDWHFRQNKREKEGIRVAKNRRWFYSVTDWIQYEEIEESEERARSSVFERMQEPTAQEPVLFNLPTGEEITRCPPASGNESDVCEICGEPFEQYFDEEEEEWHLRDAVRAGTKTYHPVCYEDATQVGMGATPITNTDVDPLSLAVPVSQTEPSDGSNTAESAMKDIKTEDGLDETDAGGSATTAVNTESAETMDTTEVVESKEDKVATTVTTTIPSLDVKMEVDGETVNNTSAETMDSENTSAVKTETDIAVKDES